MPGLNRQGPDGSGPMTGRQQGMCRRTKELPLRGGRAGQGRGMGVRSRSRSFQSQGRSFAANVSANEQFTQESAEELASLKAEYKKTQSMLEVLMHKIEGMEGVNMASDPSRTENDG